jgi:hypothetical protein
MREGIIKTRYNQNVILIKGGFSGIIVHTELSEDFEAIYFHTRSGQLMATAG